MCNLFHADEQSSLDLCSSNRYLLFDQVNLYTPASVLKYFNMQESLPRDIILTSGVYLMTFCDRKCKTSLSTVQNKSTSQVEWRWGNT